MRGLLVLIAGGLGFGAFWRKHRRKPVEGWGGQLESGDFGVDPARELRAKLAEHTSLDEAVDATQAPPSGDPLSPLDPEARRRAVHEQARASLDELK